MQNSESHLQVNLHGGDLHFLLENLGHFSWGCKQLKQSRDRNAEERKLCTCRLTSWVFFEGGGACIVSLEYPCFFLFVLGLVQMSMHSSRNTCQHVWDMLVSLLHRIDCWLARQKMTSQSNKNPAALTPIWPQFKDQQQQSGQRHTHTHTFNPHWFRRGWLHFVYLLTSRLSCNAVFLIEYEQNIFSHILLRYNLQWFILKPFNGFHFPHIQTDPSEISLGVVFVAVLKIFKINETDIK